MIYRSRAIFLLLVFWLLAGTFLAGQDLVVPPAPDRWVTDTVGFLSPETAASLNDQLQAYERQTGHQVIVYIGRSTGGVPIRDWGVKVFEAWGVGRKGLDDGLILFIMAEDRQILIEVGYGLEEKVPDVIAFRIIDRILVPGFQKGAVDASVAAAVASLITAISGEVPDDVGPAEEASPEGEARPTPLVNKIFIAIVVIVFLILFITNPTLALWLLFSIFSGGRGGGGMGGGGFRGGGGRSGGGGASGSW